MFIMCVDFWGKANYYQEIHTWCKTNISSWIGICTNLGDDGMYLRLFLAVFFFRRVLFNSLYVDNNIYDYVSMWDLGTHPEWSQRAAVIV